MGLIQNHQALKSKYPDIFKDNRGLDIGEGWLGLIDTICFSIDLYLSDNPDVPKFTLDYAKEKYGSMDLYYTGGDEYIESLVDILEKASELTCDICGKHGWMNEPPAWLKVRCQEHKGI